MDAGPVGRFKLGATKSKSANSDECCANLRASQNQLFHSAGQVIHLVYADTAIRSEIDSYPAIVDLGQKIMHRLDQVGAEYG